MADVEFCFHYHRFPKGECSRFVYGMVSGHIERSWIHQMFHGVIDSSLYKSFPGVSVDYAVVGAGVGENRCALMFSKYSVVYDACIFDG